MIQEYYIVTNKNRIGPHDLIAVIRKIRGGTITPQTLLQKGDSEAPKFAQEWPELGEFFSEKKEDYPSVTQSNNTHVQHTLSQILKGGVHFLEHNQFSTVYSSSIVLLMIVLGGTISFTLPKAIHSLGFVACFILGYFLTCCYNLVILRMVRGQSMDTNYIQTKIAPALQDLFIGSVIVAIPSLVGLVLLASSFSAIIMTIGLLILALPGLFCLTLYAFAPLLIADKGLGMWEAMEASRKHVLNNGLEYMGIIYGLFVINFLAGLCIMLPMAITLPITLSGLAETYDEKFA